MKKILVFLTIGISTLSIAQPLGVTPRKSAQDYPSVQTQGDLTLGVVQLSQKQVRKQFVSNLGKKYVVVEVGAYPKTEAKLSRLDFSLREAGSTKAILPADPTTIAAAINEQDQKGQDIAVRPVLGVELSTGRDPDDPFSGSGKRVRTTSGAMVDVNSKKKSPKASAGDVQAMSAELREKGLPEVTTKAPVAGYLYFPVSSDKPLAYELVYQSDNGKTVVPLIMPSK